ncbi:hypothetical protein COTS27_01133 [Spirochaetota bacterium]|nr:hypothetical protein COTS27_01133 [Spirochaetota bacterium]
MKRHNAIYSITYSTTGSTTCCSTAYNTAYNPFSNKNTVLALVSWIRQLNFTRFYYSFVLFIIGWVGLVDVDNLYGNYFGETSGDLGRIFAAEQTALVNDFSAYQLGSVHAYTSLTPSFFKKHFPPEWRSLVNYPLDTTSRRPFRDHFRLTTTPISLGESLFNYNVLFHFNKEGVYLPQMTAIVGHTFVIPIFRSANSPVLKALFERMHAVSLTYMLSKSLLNNLKLFTGYSYINYQGSYSAVVDNFTILGNQQLTIAEAKRFYNHLHYWIVGFAYLPTDKSFEHSFNLGLDAVNQDFFFNLEVSNRYVALGFVVVPSGIVILRPYFRLQFSI